MTTSIKKSLIAGCFSICLSGCCLIRPGAQHHQLSASKIRSQELFAENESLQVASQNLQQTLMATDAEKQMMAEQLGQVNSQLAVANSRIDNLLAERTQVKEQYIAELQDTTDDPFVTSTPSMAANVEGVKFDELTGLGKFPDDVHFDLGSAELRPESYSVLKSFASMANSASANGLRILVVGHTDDQVISQGATAAKHPTNWHLSTDRADQVILELERNGVDSTRIASMGYGEFQPLSASTDESSRQRNRRVELYLVPVSANLAVWDPVRSLN